jgi:GTPase Era involved in 16S rRNA processing
VAIVSPKPQTTRNRITHSGPRQPRGWCFSIRRGFTRRAR